MTSKILAKRDAVIASYADLSTALVKTSVVINEFNALLKGVADPAELEQLMDGVLPAGLALVAGAGKGKAKEDDVEGKKKAKKEKKPKDPNAPKRPPSAYIEFQNAVRQQFRTSDPELPYSEILRKIASVWAGMTDEEKKVWQTVTAGKALEYESAKSAYDASLAEAGAGGDVAMGDILVEATPGKTLGKDGKEYTGKKRGRKSAADKAREEAETVTAAATKGNSDPAFLQLVAQSVVDPSTAAAVDGKKKKEKKADAAKAPAPAAPGSTPKVKTPKAAAVPAKDPTPVASESEDDSSDDDSEDDSSEDDSDDSDEAAASVVAPAKINPSKTNGKTAKRVAEDETTSKKKKTKSG